MICASSSTRMPASGPGCRSRGACCRSRRRHRPTNSGFSLGEERRVADAEILGVEAVEALVVLCRRQRPRIGEPARELLVPARDERRALGDALRRRARFGGDLGVGNDARDEPLLLRLAASKMRPSSRISSATAGPTRRTSGAISAYAITSPRFLIGAPKRLDVAADPQVAQRGDLESAADADAVDLRDERMTAVRRAPAPSRASRAP